MLVVTAVPDAVSFQKTSQILKSLPSIDIWLLERFNKFRVDLLFRQLRYCLSVKYVQCINLVKIKVHGTL